MGKFADTIILWFLLGFAAGLWWSFPIPMTIGLSIVVVIMNLSTIKEAITNKFNKK